MQAEHIVPALAFWKALPGIALSAGDDVPSLSRFLAANRGMSELVFALPPHQVDCSCGTCARPELVATLLSGHDSRRGFLYHVAVHPSWQRRGLGRTLVRRAMDRFGKVGIPKVHLMCLADNPEARTFWERCGFSARPDICLMSGQP